MYDHFKNKFKATQAYKAANKITQISQIKDANRQAGLHFFDPDTMRFFSSRVHEQVYPAGECTLFVTSEKRSHRDRRLYTVRRCNPDGTIDTVGQFQEYSDRRTAHRAAKALASE